MALTIDKATVGYDQEGISTLLTDIQANVIEEAKNQLDSGKGALEETLDSIWQGHSEEVFKQNMTDDITTLKDTFDKMYSVLANEISQAAQRMGEIDQKLVERSN